MFRCVSSRQNTINALRIISYDDIKIRRLRLVYDTGSSTSSELSKTLGNMTTKNTHFQAIQLDYPREFMTSPTIYRCYVCDDDIIGFDISFKTNMGKQYGPFSPVTDTSPISYCLGSIDQFGGFHGIATRDGSEILKIGVYLQAKLVKERAATVKKESRMA